MAKKFLKLSSYIKKVKVEDTKFFINQALEWHTDGFTVKQMAREMNKWSMCGGRSVEDIQTRLYGLTRRYCVEVRQNVPITQPRPIKIFKLKTDFI